MAVKLARAGIALIAIMAVTGCADMNYSQKMSAVSANIGTSNFQQSVALLDQNNSDIAARQQNLLYNMERGELLRLSGDLMGSRDNFLVADRLVQSWEETAKNNPSELLGDAGSFLINDTTRTYEGRDYEKVLLNIELSLNHLDLASFDNARVEITKMHEREAVIAEFRAKDIENAKSVGSEKGVKISSFKEINGYPIETLNAPEVQSLKNSYESAIGHYLAGYVFEALGETSLAAPGYRKAIEMRPNVPLLESALANLGSAGNPPAAAAPVAAPAPAPAPAAAVKATASTKKVYDKTATGTKTTSSTSQSSTTKVTSAAPAAPAVVAATAAAQVAPVEGTGDVLFVIGSGMAPAVNSKEVAVLLPIPCRNGVCPEFVALSWPVIYPAASEVPNSIAVDGANYPVAFLTSVDAMARRAIYDEMPSIIARTTVRAIAKGAAQKGVDKLTEHAGLAGALFSMATKVAAVVSEVADERIWRTLPNSYSISRARFSLGQHKLTINVNGIPKEIRFNVTDKYSIVSLRIVGNNVICNSVSRISDLVASQ